jgi:hypothetical protein
MKTYKYLFLLIGLSIVGCSNLEEEPVGLLAPEGFFKSPKDIQTAVNGAYGNMTEESFWGRKLSLPLMLRSDMVGIGDQGTAARRIDHDRFSVTDDNGMITAFWPRSYQIIATANQAISGAENVPASDELKNPVTAQAYFVRAFTYFHLVRMFGDIPYIDSPVIDAEALATISKTSKADVYAKIIADLEYAKTWLPDVQPTKSMPSKAAAQAYLALVYLTMEEYANAYKEAKEVIQNESKYQLALESDFQNLFNSDAIETSKEPLFSIDYNGFRSGNYGQDYQAALTGIRGNQVGNIGGGWSVAVPSVNVFNTWDNDDYRKDVSLDVTGIFNGVEEPFANFPNFDSRNIQSAYIAKYSRFPGQTSNGNGRGSSHNYSMMRYAEVLLIAAEALNETQPGSAEADGYVNRLRARARNKDGNSSSLSPANVTAGMSQTNFRTMVLEERKWELAFECKRWYDIARRKMGPEVFGASGLEQRPSFSEGRDYLLPLPADELQRNPNLMPNNAGY